MFSEILSIILYAALAIFLIIFISRLAALLLIIGVIYYAVRLIKGKSKFQRRNRPPFNY